MPKLFKTFLFLSLSTLFLTGCNQKSANTPSNIYNNVQKEAGILDNAPEMMPVTQNFSDLAQKGICANSTADSCFAFAKRAYDAKDYRTAIYSYDIACTRYQSMQACKNLGHMFEKGEGVNPNPGIAFDIYKRLCFSGYTANCNDMVRVEKNYKR